MRCVHFLIAVSPLERTFDLDSILLEVRMRKDTTCFANFMNDGISNGALLIDVQMDYCRPRIEEIEHSLVKSLGAFICNLLKRAGVIRAPNSFSLEK